MLAQRRDKHPLDIHQTIQHVCWTGPQDPIENAPLSNCFMLQVLQVCILRKSSCSFGAPNTWNYLQNILKIDTLITPGQLKGTIQRHLTSVCSCFHWVLFFWNVNLTLTLILRIFAYLDVIANEGNRHDFWGLKEGFYLIELKNRQCPTSFQYWRLLWVWVRHCQISCVPVSVCQIWFHLTWCVLTQTTDAAEI